MQQAEHAAAQDVLNEGLQRLPNAEMLQRQGRPEREIVNVATEWRADLVMVLSVSSSQFFAAFWCLFSRVRVRRRNCRKCEGADRRTPGACRSTSDKRRAQLSGYADRSKH